MSASTEIDRVHADPNLLYQAQTRRLGQQLSIDRPQAVPEHIVIGEKLKEARVIVLGTDFDVHSFVRERVQSRTQCRRSVVVPDDLQHGLHAAGTTWRNGRIVTLPNRPANV